MSAREIWEPTPAERAEHEARHAQALADHAREIEQQLNEELLK